MDPIDGVSGVRAGVGALAANAAPGRGIASGAKPAGVPAAGGGFSEIRAAGPIWSGPIGGDGRFEKLILAVQALRLDYGPGRDRVHSTDEMRAAAKEIFSIDGVPEAFPPAVAPVTLPSARVVMMDQANSLAPAEGAAASSVAAPETPEPPPDESTG